MPPTRKCRVCLAGQGHVSLFADEVGVQLYIKIMACTAVQINKNDGFPSYLCSSCNAMLSVAFDFKTKCELSDLKLRHAMFNTRTVDVVKPIEEIPVEYSSEDDNDDVNKSDVEESTDNDEFILDDNNDDEDEEKPNISDRDDEDYNDSDRDIPMEEDDVTFSDTDNPSLLKEISSMQYKQSGSKSSSKIRMKVLLKNSEWIHCDYCTHKYKSQKHVDSHFKSVHMDITGTELRTMVYDEISAVKFLQYCGIIPRTKECKAGHPMNIHVYNVPVWRCRKRACEYQSGIRKGTWLEGYRISLEIIVRFIYEWAYEDIQHRFNISNYTLGELNSSMRKLCMWRMSQKPKFIGGPNLHVEIDGFFLRGGKKLSPLCIFAGICRETSDCFALKVTDLSAATLMPIIIERVKPGSIVFTDSSKIYNDLGKSGFIHKVVDHNDNSDPESENIHQVQKMLGSFKLGYKNRKGNPRKHLDSYLAESMWRAQVKNPNIFAAIMEEISSFWHPDPNA